MNISADGSAGSGQTDFGRQTSPARNFSDSSKLLYIDGMRGLAILMVVFVHAEQNSRMLNSDHVHSLLPFIANFGQFGVQLFFVVSAYTLCLSHGHRLKTEARPLVNFALRRYFRIAPLYYAGIAAYFMLASLRLCLKLGNSAAIARYNFWNITANVSLLHGFVPEANNTIVPGGWSIGTEIVFYAMFPAMFALYERVGVRRKYLLWIFPLLALFGGIAMNLRQHAIYGIWIEENSFSYNSIINQISVFVSGMSLYFLTCRDGDVFKSSSKTCASLAILFGAIAIALWSFDGFFLRATLVPFMAALTFACIIQATKRTRFANNALLARIGTISYSIYVIHFAILWGLALALQKCIGKVMSPLASLALLLLISVPLIFSLASLSERFIERPGIALGRRIILQLEQRVRRCRSQQTC